MTPLLLLNLIATWAMIGVIWTVQIVHYPLMAHTGPQHSALYQQLHVRKMAVLVIPIMVLEAAAAIGLILFAPSQTSWLALGLLCAIWLVTALLSVPAHDRLQDGYRSRAHRSLLASNTLRTTLWSLRGLLAVQMVLH